MNKINRLIIAAVLALLLILPAVGVWAAPTFQGRAPKKNTIPPITQAMFAIPVTGLVNCPNPVQAHMGNAVFRGCLIVVELVDDPAKTYREAAIPEGRMFYANTYTVTTDPEYPVIEACYSYPPEYEEKEASIYRLDTEASPIEWVEITEPIAVIDNGQICVTSIAGVFSLFGNP
jgi:hypothetical protein